MSFIQVDANSRVSLRSKLILWAMFFIMIPMIIVGTVTFVKSSRTLEKISTQQLIQVAESISGMIQLALEKDLQQLTQLASDPEVISHCLQGKYSNSTRKLSELYRLLSREFEGLAIYDANGIVSAEAVDKTRIGINVADRDYFATSRLGKPVIGSMVYSHATGSPIFGLSAPITSPDGRFLGGILGVVKAEYLMRYISTVKLGESGYLFMIDSQGTVIAHPDKTHILTANIRNIAELADVAESMMAKNTEVVTYSFLGNKKIAAISPIPLTGWRIGATQHMDEILALAYINMNSLLFVGTIFTILTLLAIFILSRSISAPVQTTLDTLSYAINQASEAILIIDRIGQVSFANPATAAIIDLPVENIIGQPFLAGNNRESGLEKVHSAIGNAMEWNGIIKGSKQNGSPYSLDFTLTPVLSLTGKQMCYLAVGRDITNELAMQIQLQHSQKMEAIGTLAGGIAHDFNNILSAIYGYTDLALNNLKNESLLEKYLNQIVKSGRRAGDLVSHILTFSRKTDPKKELLIPKYIVEDAVKLLRASLPTTIAIQTNLKSSATTLANATQIHQITMNLCTNAGYEMRESGGTLSVVLDEITVDHEMSKNFTNLKNDRYLRLQISDTGVGIPEETLDRIFEPFFTTKSIGKGTGLGLSVVHGIVRDFGGEIMVDSEIGKGSVFTILLPIVESELPAIKQPAPECLQKGTERILLVDDETSITETAEGLLVGLGYQVQVFNDCRQAWTAFKTEPEHFDIIITDYAMPHMTGIALAEKIRLIRPDIPIILSSGYLSLDENLERLQPIDYMKKPVTADVYAKTIRKRVAIANKPPTMPFDMSSLKN